VRVLAAVVAMLLCACGGDDGPAPTPDAGPPGARLFDPGVVHTVELDVDAATLAALPVGGALDAAVTVDGHALGLVRLVRTRGEPPPGRPEKIALRIEAGAAGIDGIDVLDLRNTTRLFHEPVLHELARRAGLPAPRTAHARLRARGQTLGYYVLLEAPSAGYVARAFPPGGGRLYEGPWDFDQDPAAAMQTLGDPEPARASLAALADAVVNAPDDGFEAAVGARLDLHAYLTAFAVESVLVCTDGYTATKDHFGLYQDPSDGRFHLVLLGAETLYAVEPVDLPPIPLNGRLAQRFMAVPALAARYRPELGRVVGFIDAPPRLDDRIVDGFDLLVAGAGGDPALEDDVARTAQSLVLLREGLAAAATFMP
jgi:hypothetical protein